MFFILRSRQDTAMPTTSLTRGGEGVARVGGVEEEEGGDIL